MNTKVHTNTMKLPKEDFAQVPFIAARSYTYDQLATLYNQTRIDYIVPMPMDGKRMMEYVHQYDVDLDASTIALGSNGSPCGVIMLGLRDDRSWITRLGIIPDQRGNKVGQYLMEVSIEKSRQLHVNCVQLEVIQGNYPAYRLFRKLGFTEVGELMVIRRPPSPLRDEHAPANALVNDLDLNTLRYCLAQRKFHTAWTEETSSLLHIDNLRGLSITFPSGETGWIVYQLLPLQLTHIVLSSQVSSDMESALLYHLHTRHPMHDTKVENLPHDHPTRPTFNKLGYIETFRRIEMRLLL